MKAPHRQRGHFLLGMLLGLLMGGALVALAQVTGLAPVTVLRDLAVAAWTLLVQNLRGSIYPFALLLLGFLVQQRRLALLLQQADPDVSQVLRHEQLLDLCANLFFGVGVIWTAVGMRDALVHALAQPAAGEQAQAILQRLVEGGILLALGTTIVGGMGGYLMRLVKSVTLGQDLTALHLSESRAPAREQLDALQRIEQLLGSAPGDGGAAR